MTADEKEFFDDMIQKIKVELQPEFRRVRKHTTKTVDAAKVELGAQIEAVKTDLGGKIDKIIAHLGL